MSGRNIDRADVLLACGTPTGECASRSPRQMMGKNVRNGAQAELPR